MLSLKIISVFGVYPKRLDYAEPSDVIVEMSIGWRVTLCSTGAAKVRLGSLLPDRMRINLGRRQGGNLKESKVRERTKEPNDFEPKWSRGEYQAPQRRAA